MEKFKKYESFSFSKTNFVGYEVLEENCEILALFNEEAELVESLIGKGYIIFDKTPLYAVSGGQASDQGKLLTKDNLELNLIDLRKDLVYGYYIHEVDTKEILVRVEDKILITVDNEYRHNSSKNHSTLHIAWQTILNLAGKYIEELGSKLDNQKCQIQFTSDELITEQIALKATELINETVISNQIETKIFFVSQKEAIEKNYLFEFTKVVGDEMVRMIEFPGIVMEPCSGTHVENTGKLQKVWFLNYDKNSKRIIIDMTSNENFAKEYFEQKLVNRLEEIKRLVQKAMDQGFEEDLSSYVKNAYELSKNWNYISIKEINKIVTEVTSIINKYYKEQEKKFIDNFANQDLNSTIIANKYNLYLTNNELFSNKILINKAIKSALDNPDLVNVFINKHSQGTNSIIIRNKELDIDLKEFNKVITSSTSFKGGGTESMIQLISQDSNDVEKLINLLK